MKDAKILDSAGKAYSAAHGGKQPTEPDQVIPYLTTPEQKAAFERIKNSKEFKAAQAEK
jgi:hypothetical protein